MIKWCIALFVSFLPISSVVYGGTGHEWFWRLRSDPDTVYRSKTDLDSQLVASRNAWLGEIGDGTIVIRMSLDLGGAYLEHADLAGDTLKGVLLCGANLSYANLRFADLTGALLGNSYGFNYECGEPAQLWSSNVYGCVFQPVDLPSIASMSTAKGLRSLRWRSSPAALVQLREEFGKLGFKQAEREVVCALRRHDAPVLETVFFDWTTEYGSNLRRPWYIFLALFLISTFVYYVSTFGVRCAGIRRITPRFLVWEKLPTREPSAEKEYEGAYYGEIHRSNSFLRENPSWLLKKLAFPVRLFGWSLFFSAMSAFNIGFRDINFGRWLRLLTRREFDLQPYGWVRVVSGLQALISVYLVALWILSFAGTPFK